MAGLGDICTHIAAVLFYIEAAVRLRGQQTCTQRKYEWIMPSFQNAIEYCRIKDIDFTSAKGKKRKLDEALEFNPSLNNDTTQQHAVTEFLANDDSDLDEFYEALSQTGTKPAILSLIHKYSDKYISKSSLAGFPKGLQQLHRTEYMNLQYHELIQACESVNIDVTDDMAKAVERETRGQQHSRLWFKYRAGRVTASRMRAVCHTTAANPSQGLVKQICYPEAYSFTSKQIEWGCKHKKAARDMYVRKQKEEHCSFQVENSGFVINPQWPFVGATPDGIISCSCCGRGVLEIKCPYCHRGESIEMSVSKDNLKKASDESFYLNQEHTYYYQVQTQLFVCDVSYSDICVCTFYI